MTKKTHLFTRNSSDTPVNIVLDKVRSFERDEFSDCTKIVYIDGDTIGVSETIEEVRAVIENT